MPSRAVLIFSFLCAALASVGMFAVTERDGDTQARIRPVVAEINAVPLLLEKHTIRARPEGAPKPQDPTIATYVLEKADGTKLVIDAHKTFKSRQIEIGADAMVSNGQKAFIAIDSAWSEMEAQLRGLTWANRREAERQSLAQFPSKPTAVSSYDWEDRHQVREFSTEEAMSFNLRRAGYSLATFAGVIVSLVLGLAAFAWLWRALLARIGELSKAIRGDGPK